MPNLKDKIDGHNNKILETTPSPKTLSNCLKKENCPNRGGCFPENILYYDNIKCENETYKPKLYKGICETIYILLYIYIYEYLNIIYIYTYTYIYNIYTNIHINYIK